MEERRGALRSRVPSQALMGKPANPTRRLTREWQPLIRATIAICIVILLLTTVALFCSVRDSREGPPKSQSSWTQPQAFLVVAPWMNQSRIVGQVIPRAQQKADAAQHSSQAPDLHELQDTDALADDLARISQMVEALSGDEHPVLNTVRPPVRKFCMYSERNSGSNWVSSLIEANFHLDYVTAACPHKHDLGMSVPNEFLFLPADVLVVAVFRNAFDWAASMHRHPWHAANHCNTSTFADFLLKEWSPNGLAGGPNLLHAKPYCPRYDTNHSRMPMIYEHIGGMYAANILELRAWKAARALEICQTRKQSVCVRHEDLIENTNSWLLEFQEQFKLKTKPGFPIEVVSYKGVKGREKFIPHSEYNTMRFGNAHSAYYNDDTMKIMRMHLDMPLETFLGYFYTDIFTRWLSDDPEFDQIKLPEAFRAGLDVNVNVAARSEMEEGDPPPDMVAAAAQETTTSGRKMMEPIVQLRTS